GFAAAKTAPKTAAKTGAAPSNGKMAAGHTVSYSGMVKGSPSGKTFTLAMRKKTATVDASGAKVRVNGKLPKFEDALKGGTQVSVKGTESGSTVKATDINAHPRGGAKPACKGGKGAAMGGAKGGGMMGGAR